MYNLRIVCLAILLAKYGSADLSTCARNTYADDQCMGDMNLTKFTKIGAKYYLIGSSYKTNWFEAAHTCRAHNANLATITNCDEMKLVSDYLTSKGYTKDDWFWVSGNDLSQEGKFFWISNGEQISYANWSNGQPDNNGGNENCVHLWLQNNEFQMNDWVCKNQAFFICQAADPKNISFCVW